MNFQIEIIKINHDDHPDSDASIPYAESDVDSNLESDIDSEE